MKYLQVWLGRRLDLLPRPGLCTLGFDGSRVCALGSGGTRLRVLDPEETGLGGPVLHWFASSGSGTLPARPPLWNTQQVRQEFGVVNTDIITVSIKVFWLTLALYWLYSDLRLPGLLPLLSPLPLSLQPLLVPLVSLLTQNKRTPLSTKHTHTHRRQQQNKQQ